MSQQDTKDLKQMAKENEVIKIHLEHGHQNGLHGREKQCIIDTIHLEWCSCFLEIPVSFVFLRFYFKQTTTTTTILRPPGLCPGLPR